MKALRILKRLSRRALFLGAAMLVLVLALSLLEDVSGSVDAASESVVRPRTVTVVEAIAGEHRAEIAGLAQVSPRWLSTLRAQVGGVLQKVSLNLQPGSRVSAGDLLAVVDPTPWIANLKEAENRVVLAELELLRQEQEAEEARESWQNSGLDGEPSSILVLRGPQIEAAKAELEAAQSARAWARQQLEYTEIRAPFKGVVSARHVSRGESITEGEPVAQIFSVEVFELALQVSETQWRNLPDPLIGTAATVGEPAGPGRWHAAVARVAGAIDETTRMRTLYLTVTDPLASESPLLPGTFVRARFEGDPVPQALELPEGVLTRSGHIWYVDDDDTLQRFSALQLFTRPGRIYVSEPAPTSVWRIVKYPLDSYMVGQAVQPVVDTAAEGEV